MSRGSVLHSYEYISTYLNVIQQISPDRFILKIRQQPIQTRLSTSNERDRRPLDPPPIVQIELDNATAQETQDFLQNPYLFMCVSLVHPTTHKEVISTTQNTLSGQTSSSIYKLKDINNHDGGFFVFGDVSVKLGGQFRLKFSMFEISQFGATNLKSIYSNVFQVYPSKSFPGMLESTFLSRSFSDQGVRIRIRKEHRVQMTGSRKRKLSSQDESLESDDRSPSSYVVDQSHHYHLQQQQQQQQFIQALPPQHQKPMLRSNHGQHPYHTSESYQPPLQQQHPLPSSQHQHYWSPNADSHSNSCDNRRGSSNSIMTASSDMRVNYPRRLSHIDRRPSIPFSPPHQSYDNNSRLVSASNDYNNHYDCNSPRSYHPQSPYHHQQQQQHQQQHLIVHRNNTMIPSPPLQASLFTPESRRLSLDDTLSNGGGMRRQSADPHLYNANHYRRGSRRMSLQQQSPHIVYPSPQHLFTATRRPSSSANSNNLRSEEVIHLPPLRNIARNSSSNNRIQQQQRQQQAEQRLHTASSSPPLSPPITKQQNYQYFPHHYYPHQQPQQHQDAIGEVDAAVAMMQLASRRQVGTKSY